MKGLQNKQPKIVLGSVQVMLRAVQYVSHTTAARNGVLFHVATGSLEVGFLTPRFS